MKQVISIVVFFVFPFFGLSQIQGDGGESLFLFSQKNSVPELTNIGIHQVSFPKPDIKKLREEDAVNDEKGNAPWRFGYNHETALTLENSGTWFSLNGGKLWLLTIKCEDAQTINLTFENTVIPQGNHLYVHNPDASVVLGKFTQKHIYEGQLGTELVSGETVLVEYYVAPENTNNIGQLTIATVTHGYRVVEEFQEKAFGQAGACNMNVNCPDGADFANQKRSVVMLVSGSNGFCSGALINNTEYDGKPYVLTANHCYSSPASWIFRFNWESPDCTNPGSEPSFTSLSGAVLRARRTASDMCLVEITGGLEAGTIPSSFNAYFSGWDRTGANPDWTVGIHHPKGDIKKISFDDDTSFPTQSSIGGVTSDVNGVWRVQWDRNTTTEPVSSGSSLFDHNKRIIGQLWGGQASCSNPNGPDFYGRIHTSWNPLGSDASNQLEHWLDPSSTGAIVVDGYEPNVLVSNDGALILVKEIKGTVCNNDLTPKFTLVNMGQTALTTAEISYGIDGNETETYNWSGNLGFLASEEITLPQLTVATGGHHTFSATITAVNGGGDEVSENNQVLSSFFVMENPEIIDLNLTLDCYASENSWTLVNSEDVELYRSSAYTNADEGLHNYEFCLSEDCYTFTVYDSYGDGMAYCSGGNFQILNELSSVLAEMTPAQANFGASFAVNFCLGEASVGHLEQLIGVYPNPSLGMVFWNADNVRFVSVYDLNGKALMQEKIEHHTKQLDINELSNGVYLIEFDTYENVKIQKKIVLMRK